MTKYRRMRLRATKPLLLPILAALAVFGCSSAPVVVQKCPPLPPLPPSLAKPPLNLDLIPDEMKPYLLNDAKKSQTAP